MKARTFGLVICLGLGTSASASAQQSALRITCTDTGGAIDIAINGVDKGACPLDATVKPGAVVVRASRLVDETHEQVYETQLRLGEGAVKRLDIQLPPARLTKAAEIAEAERQRRDAERARAEEAQAAHRRSVSEALREENRKFEAERASRTLGAKRRAAFDQLDRFKASASYNTVPSATREDISLLLSLPVERYRDFPDSTAISTNRLVLEDAFFDLPAGDGNPGVSDYVFRIFDVKNTCTRAGRAAQIDSVLQERALFGGVKLSRRTTALLGGVITQRETQFPTVTMGNPSSSLVLSRIHSLFGQPFPLKPNSRFGLAYQTKTSYGSTEGPVDEWVMSCTATTGVENKPGQVVCLSVSERYPTSHVLTRYVWDQSSGCMRPHAPETGLTW